jgi:hypothetical protein
MGSHEPSLATSNPIKAVCNPYATLRGLGTARLEASCTGPYQGPFSRGLARARAEGLAGNREIPCKGPCERPAVGPNAEPAKRPRRGERPFSRGLETTVRGTVRGALPVASSGSLRGRGALQGPAFPRGAFSGLASRHIVGFAPCSLIHQDGSRTRRAGTPLQGTARGSLIGSLKEASQATAHSAGQVTFALQGPVPLGFARTRARRVLPSRTREPIGYPIREPINPMSHSVAQGVCRFFRPG